MKTWLKDLWGAVILVLGLLAWGLFFDSLGK